MKPDPHSVKLIKAPAKLNLRLKVIDRRPDGYHEIVSIMAPVALYDYLQLSKIQSGIKFICRGIPVPDNEGNLIFRAAQIFFSSTGIKPGLLIKLAKNIPVAAGLGGGSSDAGCTLTALNEMFDSPLSHHELLELATRLGADVPFFLQSRPCIARGIGEILEPIRKWLKFWYVIVKPPIKVSTSWAYGNLKLQLTTGEYNYIRQYFGNNNFNILNILENDLEMVTASHFPVISKIKKTLADAGAEGVLMSGSGPSVFGIFKSKKRALLAKKYHALQNFGDIFLVEGIGSTQEAVLGQPPV